jgi:hypothetical protein
MFMEQQPQHEGDLPSDETARAAKRERRITEELEIAWRTGQRIDDWTAKQIARGFDPGEGPLHEFAATGAILPGIEVDLTVAAEVTQDLESEADLPRITALGEYFAGRLIRTEIPYWNDPSME